MILIIMIAQESMKFNKGMHTAYFIISMKLIFNLFIESDVHNLMSLKE